MSEAVGESVGEAGHVLVIGVDGVAGHGITGNDLTGHRLAEHPDFVTRATRAGLPTLLAVSGWPPLALAEDGGPLFAEASTREFVPVPPAGPDGAAGRRPAGRPTARRGPGPPLRTAGALDGGGGHRPARNRWRRWCWEPRGWVEAGAPSTGDQERGHGTGAGDQARLD